MAQSLSKKFDRFLVQNSDLIEQYESQVSGLPTETFKDDIISAYKDVQKKNKGLDFNTLLSDSFAQAIIKEAPVADVIRETGQWVEKEGRPQNSLQTYFKEINSIYEANGNNYNLEYCEENRDKLISLNTKSVISIAKRYQGLGLSLPELISAGNLGLCVAWDKFDPSRARLKEDILEIVDGLPDEFTGEDLMKAVSPFLKYGDIQKKIDARFPKDARVTRHEARRWVQANIFSAKFSSIGTMWCRAFILIEIDNYSRIVKKPKSEIYKDREKYGAYKKEITLDIDAPINGDSGTVFGDLLPVGEEDHSDLETMDAYTEFREGLSKLLDGVKSRDRAIFLKKFGIGLPRPMLPKELAESEGLSVARISQILLAVLNQMRQNAVKFGIDQSSLFEAIKHFD